MSRSEAAQLTICGTAYQSSRMHLSLQRTEEAPCHIDPVGICGWPRRWRSPAALCWPEARPRRRRPTSPSGRCCSAGSRGPTSRSPRPSASRVHLRPLLRPGPAADRVQRAAPVQQRDHRRRPDDRDRRLVRVPDDQGGPGHLRRPVQPAGPAVLQDHPAGRGGARLGPHRRQRRPRLGRGDHPGRGVVARYGARRQHPPGRDARSPRPRARLGSRRSSRPRTTSSTITSAR